MSDTGTDLIERQDAALPAVAQEPGSLLQAIVALAKDPGVDVAKLDALLQMQRQMEDRGAQREFNTALIELQSKLPRIRKNGTLAYPQKAGQPDKIISKYAKWEDIDAVIRPVCEVHGFVLGFDTQPRQGEGGGLIVTAILRHRAGHVERTSIPIPLDTSGGKNNIQGYGSALSYGKRYAVTAALNIITEGEDDDGKRGGAEFITTEQAAELDGMIREQGLDPEKFLHQFFEVLDVRSLEAAQFVPAKNMLLARKKRA